MAFFRRAVKRLMGGREQSARVREQVLLAEIAMQCQDNEYKFRGEPMGVVSVTALMRTRLAEVEDAVFAGDFAEAREIMVRVSALSVRGLRQVDDLSLVRGRSGEKK